MSTAITICLIPLPAVLLVIEYHLFISKVMTNAGYNIMLILQIQITQNVIRQKLKEIQSPY